MAEHHFLPDDQPSVARTAPAGTADTPDQEDMTSLNLCADGLGAAAVSCRTGRSLSSIADRLHSLRRYYGVTSTRADIERARQLGDIPGAGW